MSSASSHKITFIALLGLFSLCTLSGCIPGKYISTSPPSPQLISEEQLMELRDENVNLVEENRLLKQTIKSQKNSVAALQQSLLEKHAEVDELLLKNERLVKAFVLNKKQKSSRGNKVEAVRLLAEVAAVIDTARSKDWDGNWGETISRAEEHLINSRKEVANNNFEGATYLANQALDLILSTRLDDKNPTPQSDTEVNFITHMEMTALKNISVREEPSMESKILFVQQAGTTVTATGYNGDWIKLKFEDDKLGWAHLSLLSITPN